MTTQDLALLIVAGAVVVIALAFVVIALSARAMVRDTRGLIQRTERLTATLETELPPTLDSVQALTRSVDQLTSGVEARLERADQLADEAERTLVSIRTLSATLNDLVRGPVDTVSGVKRGAKIVGEGIVSGADRLRRAMTRDVDDDEPGDDAA